MKAIVCELCGSNDIVKQDGLYVCQHCGTKYTLEEARKLMNDSEEPVSVKVDNSAQIKNSLVIARNACKSGNYKEAESYANKILEMDPSCAEAWEIKGIATGWQSTLGNIRFGESIECWSQAVSLCGEEDKPALKKRIGSEMSKLVVSLVSTRANSFSSLPSESSYNELSDCSTIFDSIITFIVKIGSGVIDEDSIFEKCAKIMHESAVQGANYSDSAYGPDKSHNTRYAYTTWLERIGYCINILLLAMPLAQEKSTVEMIFDAAVRNQRKVISSECYRFEANEFGSQYVVDYNLSVSAKAMKENEIREWEQKKDAEIHRIEEKKQEKRQEDIKKYWKEHAKDKEIIERARDEIFQEKKNNTDIAQIINADAVIREIDAVLSDMEESDINSLLEEIENPGLLMSRYEKKYLELKDCVRPETEASHLKEAEEKLVLFGQYKESPMLLEKCREYLPTVEKKEEEETKKRIEELFDVLDKTTSPTEIEGLRTIMIAAVEDYKVVDEQEINRRVDDRLVTAKKEILANEKKKKRKIVIIVSAVLLSVALLLAYLFAIGPAIFSKKIQAQIQNGNYDTAEKMIKNKYSAGSNNYKKNMYVVGKASLEDSFVYKKKYHVGGIKRTKKIFEECGDYENSNEYISYCDVLLMFEEGISLETLNKYMNNANIGETQYMKDDLAVLANGYSSRAYARISDSINKSISSKEATVYKIQKDGKVEEDCLYFNSNSLPEYIVDFKVEGTDDNLIFKYDIQKGFYLAGLGYLDYNLEEDNFKSSHETYKREDWWYSVRREGSVNKR